MFVAVLLFVGSSAVATQPSETTHGITADGRVITARGREHRPWASDIIAMPQPQLPASLRAQHRGGEALCRVILDLRSGIVRDVVIVQSSGFPELDASIVRTLRQWRLRSGRWREFEIYVGLWSSPPAKRKA